jgi:hypothetical protein
LIVLLKYLGTEGSGCSNPDLRNVFHMDRGTCQLYRERALTAIRSLQDATVIWPDQAERSQIAQQIHNREMLRYTLDGSMGTPSVP